MGSRFYQLVVDAHDPGALARFWAAVLDVEVLYDEPDEVIIGTGIHDYPGISFIRVSDDKAVKNRLHLDLDPDDREAEVERIVALGARRADIGQGDPSWTVLTDPEGNEFCVLRPHRSLID
jgi:predicted enzyme related to lactoylglutathione lyase